MRGTRWARAGLLLAITTASTGCQHTGLVVTGLLELPGHVRDIDRLARRAQSQHPGSPPTPSAEEAAVIEQEHRQRMEPLQIASAALLAGETYWMRGTARFVIVVRSPRPDGAVVGVEVAETEEGSRVHEICRVASECPEGSTKLSVETMRWLRKNKLESGELVRALTLSQAELTWQAPFVRLVSHGDVTTLRRLPAGADPYAVAISPDGALALLRVRNGEHEQATVVRIPDRTPFALTAQRLRAGHHASIGLPGFRLMVLAIAA